MKSNELEQLFEYLEERFGSFDQQLSDIDAHFSDVDEKFESIDRKLDDIGEKFENVDRKFDNVDEKFVRVGAKTEDGFAKLFRYVNERFDEIEAMIAAKADGDRVYTMLDGIVARLEADEIERAAMSRQLDRHERSSASHRSSNDHTA